MEIARDGIGGYSGGLGDREEGEEKEGVAGREAIARVTSAIAE